MNEENNNNNNYPANGEEMEIDLRELIRVFLKWMRMIIVMTLLTVVCAAAVNTWVLQPVYQARTLLMVNKATEKLQVAPHASGNQLDDVVGVGSPVPVLTMSTYLGQLKSEALMNRIIEDIDLSCSAGALAGQIEAEMVKDSNLINIKVNNTDPLLAGRIANSLTAQYQRLMNEKNQDQLSRSVVFLEKQRAETDEDLQKAEDELKQFQSQPGGVTVLETEFQQKATSQAQLSTQLQAAYVEQQQYSSGVARLEQELAATPQTLIIEKWDETTANAPHFGHTEEINPLYVSLAQELAVRRAALAEKEGQITGLEVLVGHLKTELDALQAQLAGKRLQQDKLKREVDRLKQAAETLAQRSMETQIAKSIDLGETTVTVISEASIPSKPIKPNKKLNMAIAAVLGLMVFTLLAFVLEYLDNTIKTPEDISRHLELPVLGVIPLSTTATVKKGYYHGGK